MRTPGVIAITAGAMLVGLLGGTAVKGVAAQSTEDDLLARVSEAEDLVAEAQAGWRNAVFDAESARDACADVIADDDDAIEYLRNGLYDQLDAVKGFFSSWSVYSGDSSRLSTTAFFGASRADAMASRDPLIASALRACLEPDIDRP